MTSNEDHALGAVLGALVGDAAGAVLEFFPGEITGADVDRALAMSGGGAWRTAPGQITDDGELTMSLLRALVDDPKRPTERAAVHYARWVDSDPFDIGATTRASLGCLRDPELAALAESEGAWSVMTAIAKRRCMESKANGSLMRATPLGVWSAQRPFEIAMSVTSADARLSHPNEACVGAARAYVAALRHLIREPADVQGALADAMRAAEQNEEVTTWLDEARRNVSVPYSPHDGFVRIGFTHAFRHLFLGTDYLDALRETLLGGGDTDTNACIVGGLLGARSGANAIPASMRAAVLECDQSAGNHRRPAELHPRQVPELIRRLHAPPAGLRP